MSEAKPLPQEVEAALAYHTPDESGMYQCCLHGGALASEVRRLRVYFRIADAVLNAAWEARHAYFSSAPEKSRQERLKKAMWDLAHVLGEHLTASPQEPKR